MHPTRCCLDCSEIPSIPAAYRRKLLMRMTPLRSSTQIDAGAESVRCDLDFTGANLAGNQPPGQSLEQQLGAISTALAGQRKAFGIARLFDELITRPGVTRIKNRSVPSQITRSPTAHRALQRHTRRVFQPQNCLLEKTVGLSHIVRSLCHRTGPYGAHSAVPSL